MKKSGLSRDLIDVGVDPEGLYNVVNDLRKQRNKFKGTKAGNNYKRGIYQGSEPIKVITNCLDRIHELSLYNPSKLPIKTHQEYPLALLEDLGVWPSNLLRVVKAAWLTVRHSPYSEIASVLSNQKVTYDQDEIVFKPRDMKTSISKLDKYDIDYDAYNGELSIPINPSIVNVDDIEEVVDIRNALYALHKFSILSTPVDIQQADKLTDQFYKLM